MLRTVGTGEEGADVVSHGVEHLVQIHPFLGVALFHVLLQSERVEQGPQRTRVAAIVRLTASTSGPAREFRLEVIVVLLQIVQEVVNVKLLFFSLQKLIKTLNELDEFRIVGRKVAFDDLEEALQYVQLATVQRLFERNLMEERVADRAVQIAQIQRHVLRLHIGALTGVINVLVVSLVAVRYAFQLQELTVEQVLIDVVYIVGGLILFAQW